MTFEDYISEIDVLRDGIDTEIPDSLAASIARRAVQLQSDCLDKEDILEELMDLIPKKYSNSDDVYEILANLSETIISELDEVDEVDYTDEE